MLYIITSVETSPFGIPITVPCVSIIFPVSVSPIPIHPLPLYTTLTATPSCNPGEGCCVVDTTGATTGDTGAGLDETVGIGVLTGGAVKLTGIGVGMIDCPETSRYNATKHSKYICKFIGAPCVQYRNEDSGCLIMR
mmetsp:Transcript_24928/g.35723  ORF Transcript_24928/g.35723 Transcript_24928/m.35723 type:complete len:137 (+) Transcript_24928:492-902(+)